MSRHSMLLIVSLIGAACVLHAEAPETGTSVQWGAFVDSYYAWDFDRPLNFDRAYATQPARHAEFNINLAFIEAKLTGPRLRGRLALQWGTSVQANYAGEPKIGNISGPGISQFIQEATVGYQISHATWLDAGIFPAHLGYESWISRDNLTYTRSLVAEFSPYYEAGVKLTWAASPKVTATFAILNGWQDISNYNTPPAGGVRLDWTPSEKLTLGFDNFVGDAAADKTPARMRVYHDLIAQYKPGPRWTLAAVLSHGLETRSTPAGGTGFWWGGTAMAKFQATSSLAVVGRVETYSDPHQIIVITGLPDSFRATGASIGMDVTLARPGPVAHRAAGLPLPRCRLADGPPGRPAILGRRRCNLAGGDVLSLDSRRRSDAAPARDRARRSWTDAGAQTPRRRHRVADACGRRVSAPRRGSTGQGAPGQRSGR